MAAQGDAGRRNARPKVEDSLTRLLKGIASAYAGRLSAVLATFVLVPLLIARLGLEEFGLYATVAAMGILLSQDFGLAGATTRFVANAHSKSEFHRLRPIVTSSVVFFCSLGAFAAVAVAAFAVYVAGGRGDVTYIALIAAANAFGALFGAVDRSVLIGAGRIIAVNVVFVAQNASRVLLAILVLAHWPNPVAALAVDLAATLLGVIGWGFYRRAVIHAPSSGATRWQTEWKPMFRFSADLAAMTLAGTLVLQGGTIVSSLKLPLASVAVYAAANRAFLLVREATNSLTIAILPEAAKNHAIGDVYANRRLWVIGTQYANLFLLMVLVPILAFASPLLRYWLGIDDPDLGWVAQILIASMIINNNHVIAVPILMGLGKVRVYAALHAVWSASALVLAWVFAAPFGPVGVAAGMTVPLLLLEPLYLWYAAKCLDQPVMSFVKDAVMRPYVVMLGPVALFSGYLALVGRATQGAWVVLGGGCIVWLVGVALALALLRRRVLVSEEPRPTESGGNSGYRADMNIGRSTEVPGGKPTQWVLIYTKDGRESSSYYYRVHQYMEELGRDSKVRICRRQLAPDWLWKARYDVVGRESHVLLRGALVRVAYVYCLLFRGTFFLARDALRSNPYSVVVLRSLFPRGLNWVTRALYARVLQRAKVAIWDCDDNVEVSGELAEVERSLLISRSDALQFTHAGLIPLARPRRDVLIVPTTDGDFEGWDADDVRSLRSVDLTTNVNLVWVGSSSGLQDLGRVIEHLEDAARLLKEGSSRLMRLTVVCNRPLRTTTSHLEVRNVPWSRKAAIDEIRAAHIGLMPLSDSEFARGKGAFKVVQYLAAGLPVVASATGFNVEVLRGSGAGVLVAEPSEGERLSEHWRDALLGLSDLESWCVASLASRTRWQTAFSFEDNLAGWRERLIV